MVPDMNRAFSARLFWVAMNPGASPQAVTFRSLDAQTLSLSETKSAWLAMFEGEAEEVLK